MSLVRLAAQSTRQLSSTAARTGKAEVAEGYLKLKDTQARFQKNDGKPVHLKSGATDTMLYYITAAACGAGLIGAAHLYYQIIFPKKEE